MSSAGGRTSSRGSGGGSSSSTASGRRGWGGAAGPQAAETSRRTDGDSRSQQQRQQQQSPEAPTRPLPPNGVFLQTFADAVDEAGSIFQGVSIARTVAVVARAADRYGSPTFQAQLGLALLHQSGVQLLAAEDVADSLLQTLEPRVTAAAREGAESGSGGNGGRVGGGGTMGASLSWMLVIFSDLFKSSSAKEWACKEEILLHAAHLIAGGSAEIDCNAFEDKVAKSFTPARSKLSSNVREPMLKSMALRLEQCTKYLPAFRQQSEEKYLANFVRQEVEREKGGEDDDDDISSYDDDDITLTHITEAFPRFYKAIEFGHRPGEMANVAFAGVLSKRKERSSQAVAPTLADVLNVRCLDRFDPQAPVVSGARLVDQQVLGKVADDVFSVAFDVLRDARNAHRDGNQSGGGRRDRGSRGARQLPDSQDSTEAAGFDAPGRMLEFLRHHLRPAPGGGSGREGEGQSSKKRRKRKSGGATPPAPPPKKYPSVDDQFFSDSLYHRLGNVLRTTVLDDAPPIDEVKTKRDGEAILMPYTVTDDDGSD